MILSTKDLKAPLSESELLQAPAKNRKRLELKRRQIVKGACRLFFEKGFHPTSIREIALSCGMSMGQLYHYVSSKDDVLFLVYAHMQEIWLKGLDRAALEKIQNPTERLRSALASTLKLVGDNRELFLFVYTETKHLCKDHLRQVLSIDNNEIVGLWRGIIGDCQGLEGEKIDNEWAANLISFLVMFPALRGWNLDQTKNNIHNEAMIDFVMMGLGLI